MHVLTCSTQSQLDRFLCLVELAEHFPLALLRPLPDHTPLVWAGYEEHDKFKYFKLDRSWLREVGFKEVEESMEVIEERQRHLPLELNYRSILWGPKVYLGRETQEEKGGTNKSKVPRPSRGCEESRRGGPRLEGMTGSGSRRGP